MEVLALLFFLWAWDGNLWEEVDPEPEEPVVEQSTPVPDNAVDVTQVTQTAAVITAVGEALTGTSTSTSTAEIEAQIIAELENMDETTTTVPITTTATGSSTSTSTSTGT
jgi:hypothetical protein